jgi:hypothetical protein
MYSDILQYYTMFCGRSVGIVRSRTQTMEFSFSFFIPCSDIIKDPFLTLAKQGSPVGNKPLLHIKSTGPDF